jgi:hypothetical protein
MNLLNKLVWIANDSSDLLIDDWIGFHSINVLKQFGHFWMEIE